MKLNLLLLLIALTSCTSQRHLAVKTLDTDFSKGRLSFQQRLELKDLVKFHGHLCDGLGVGYLGLKEALNLLYPDGIVDRTNTRIVSKPSPCLTDAAIYLSGGRYQYNTFYVSSKIEPLFIVTRLDTDKSVTVTLKPGVKPSTIDSLGKLADKGLLDPCELDKLRNLEARFLHYLLHSNSSQNFIVEELGSFKWNPVLQNDFVKTDVFNKNQPSCKH